MGLDEPVPGPVAGSDEGQAGGEAARPPDVILNEVKNLGERGEPLSEVSSGGLSYDGISRHSNRQ